MAKATASVTTPIGHNFVTGHVPQQYVSKGVKRRSASETGQAGVPAPCSNQQSYGFGGVIDALGDHLETLSPRRENFGSPVKKVQKTVPRPGRGSRDTRKQDKGEALIDGLVNGKKVTDFEHLDDKSVITTLKILNIRYDEGHETKKELRAKLIAHVREQLEIRLANKPDMLQFRIAVLRLSSPQKNLAGAKNLSKQMVQKTRQVFTNDPTEDIPKRIAEHVEVLFPLNNRGLYCPQLEQEGNTCFTNQVLASLLSLSSVQEFLTQNRENKHVKMLLNLAKLKPSETKGTYELRRQITRFNKMTETVSGQKSNYTDGRQQDAAEFLTDLLDFLVWDGTKDTDNTLVNLQFEIRELFQSVDTSIFKCSAGNGNCQLREVPQVQHFPVTELAISGSSLQDAFDFEDKYREWDCFDCGSNDCERIVRTAICLPEVLIIQLKRFNYDENGRKLTKEMDVPLEWQPFGESSTPYRLRAVTIHQGQFMNQGHYFGLTINPSGEFAFKMNDAQEPVPVRYIQVPFFYLYFFCYQIHGSENIRKEAGKGYLFFYEKKSLGATEVGLARPMGGARSQQAHKQTASDVKETMIADLVKRKTPLDLETLTRADVLCYIWGLDIKTNANPEAMTVAELKSVLAKALDAILNVQTDPILTPDKKTQSPTKSMLAFGYTNNRWTTTINILFLGLAKAMSSKLTWKQIVGANKTSSSSCGNVGFLDGSVEKIVELLDVLDEDFPTDRLKQIDMNICGTDQAETHLDRLLPRIRDALVRQLVMKMEVDEMLKLLSDYSHVKLNRHNDRVAGQLKSEALKNEGLLDRIVAIVAPSQRIFERLKGDQARHTEHWLGVLEKNSFTKRELRQLYRWHFQQDLDGRKEQSRHVAALKKKIMSDLVEIIPLQETKHIIRFSNKKIQEDNRVHSQLATMCLNNQVDMRIVYDWMKTNDNLSQMATPEKKSQPSHSKAGVVRTNLDQELERMSESLRRNLSVTEPMQLSPASTPNMTVDEELDQSGSVDTLKAIFHHMEMLKLVENNNDPVLSKLHQELVGKKETHKGRLKGQVQEVLVNKLLGQLDTDQKRAILHDLPGVKVHKHNDKIHGQLQKEALKNDAAIQLIKKVLQSSEQLSGTTNTLSDSQSWIQEHIALLDKVSVCQLYLFKKMISSILQKVDNEELDQWEAEKIYKELYKVGVHKSTKKPKVLGKVRHKIVQELVCTLSADLVTDILQQSRGRPGDLVHTQLIKLALKKKEVLQLVKQVVTEVQQETVHAQQQEPSDQDRAEETVLEELRQAEGEEMGLGNVSQEESVILMSPSDGVNSRSTLEQLPDDQLEEYYRSLGGVAKKPRRANMEQFVHLRLVDRLVKGLPEYVLTSLVLDHNIEVERPGRTITAIKKKALDDRLFLATLVALTNDTPPHDFNRTHKPTIDRSFARLVDIRTKRNNDLKQGVFKLLPNGTPRNPILETGKKMEKKLEALKFVQCKICFESRLNIDPESRTCKRCLNERPDKDFPYTFSPDNNMFPGPLPPPLKGLTMVEQKAISPFRTEMTIIKMKGGGTKHKGHSISFTQNVSKFARKLPRLPDDLGIVNLKTPFRDLELKANKFKMMNAIRWLCDNNPIYREHCELSLENCEHYPADGSPVLGIPIIEDNNPENSTETEEQEPTDIDDHGAPEEGHGDFFESAVNQAVPVEPTDSRICDALQTRRPTGEQDQLPLTEDDVEMDTVTLDFPERGQTPMSEFSRGYFTLNYPYLFPTGAGDITLDRDGKQPKLKDWIEHLIWLPEVDGSSNRFASNFFFIFHTVNIVQRRQMMGIGTIMADRVLQDKTPDEFRALATDPDSNILKCMSHISSTVAGSNAHMKGLRKTAIAAERAIRIVSNNKERFNVFITLSYPDNHLEHLHRLLPGHEQYLGKTVVPEMLEGLNPLLFIDKSTDYLLRQKAINENGHIVNDFIHRRLDMLMKEILTQHLGVLDIMVRSEFQSRSAIHFHCLARCPGVSQAELETAFQKYVDVNQLRTDMSESPEEDIKATLDAYRKEGYKMVHDEAIVADIKTKQESVLHFATNVMGISAVNPEDDPFKLAPPEGFNPHPPPTNALRTTLCAVERDPNVSFDSDYRDIFQRVMLHTCRPGYCWKLNERDKDKQKCRFRYPMSLCGYSEMQDRSVEHMTPKGLKKINLIRRNTDAVPDSAIFNAGNLVFIRNHPRTVEAIPELLRYREKKCKHLRNWLHSHLQ